MITLKELSYVSDWARKTPYPGIKYAEDVADKLFQAVDNYNKNYKEKEYDIILSDGSQFTFEIACKNLCHMLGIDFKNLSSDYFKAFRENILGTDNFNGSYGFLQLLLEHIDDVLKYDYEHGGVFNYYKMMIKCSIFEKLSNFSDFNFGVINFDKPTFEEKSNGATFHSNAEKLLYVQSNEQNCPYFMMGILKDNVDREEVQSNYVVETLFAPSNVRNIFNGQKVAIPTQILIIGDAMQKIEATAREKLALINQYKSIVAEYDIPNNIDIYGDYLATLTREDNESGVQLTRKR